MAQRYLDAQPLDNLLCSGRRKHISFAEQARCRAPNTAGRSALTLRPGRKTITTQDSTGAGTFGLVTDTAP